MYNVYLVLGCNSALRAGEVDVSPKQGDDPLIHALNA